MTDLFPCFEANCDGTVRKETINHKVTLSNGDIVAVNNLIVEKCSKCGEILFDSAACKQIEKAVIAIYPNYYKR